MPKGIPVDPEEQKYGGNLKGVYIEEDDNQADDG